MIKTIFPPSRALTLFINACLWWILLTSQNVSQAFVVRLTSARTGSSFVGGRARDFSYTTTTSIRHETLHSFCLVNLRRHSHSNDREWIMPSSSKEFRTEERILPGVWYSDEELMRSEIPEMTVSTLSQARFLIAQEEERRPRKNVVCHWYQQEVDSEVVIPLYLNFTDLVTAMLGDEDGQDELLLTLLLQNETALDPKLQVFWIGQRCAIDYFVVYIDKANDEQSYGIHPKLSDNIHCQAAPLREFGDRISSPQDAAIYSTANALIEFHKSHKFCSYCGSRTVSRKAGSSRICSNHGPPASSSSARSCHSPSIYPRIDVASIMLITSPCENYALLGRKKSWPKGRYSTLAGFLEIGETIEQCCIRETLEESGVQVDPGSLRFVRSQPWPFPRSLMTGFRGRALPGVSPTQVGNHLLPEITFDEAEMEDVRWFHRSYVAERITDGSTALEYKPTCEEEEFHIPGKSSLARYLILQWVCEGKKLNEI